MKPIAFALAGLGFFLLGCQAQDQNGAETQGQAESSAPQSGSATISGAGATFPFPIYSRWAASYRDETGNSLNYQSIGSGGGIRQIQEKTVTFGATDMPLSPADLDEHGLLQFPTVIGGDVAVVNLPGIEPGELVLDGPALARIFLGEITNWNDAAIMGLNPDAQLPDLPIVVVHRSDGSGTTFIFTDYLSKISSEWQERVGAATAIDWPVGLGAKGNEGVAGNVGRTLGAIGYVEYAYASEAGLTYTRMVNMDGNAVSPSIESFMAAAAGASWDASRGFGTLLNNQPGAASWPMAGATFILVYKQPSDPAATAEALKFFRWAFDNGDEMASQLHFVPLPAGLTDEIQAEWHQIAGWEG
nr:MAG: phosphate ABC transporter substrate-binding protein PstS [Hyphomicrobiales bacterium]